MAKRVYGLKKATPKMKYQHMEMMLDFQDKLRRNQENPPARHVALEQIKELMGLVPFNRWYDEVYALRRDGKQEEYEQAIFDKLDGLHAQRIADE